MTYSLKHINNCPIFPLAHRKLLVAERTIVFVLQLLDVLQIAHIDVDTVEGVDVLLVHRRHHTHRDERVFGLQNWGNYTRTDGPNFAQLLHGTVLEVKGNEGKLLGVIE